jgi:hypothetical protein
MLDGYYNMGNMRNIPARSSDNKYLQDFILLMVFISFGVFSYFNFNKYALKGNIMWIIFPGIFLILMLFYNLFLSLSLSNILITLAIVFVSISLLYSAGYIRSLDENKEEEIVNKIEVKYLVSIIGFIGVGLLSISPIADWIGGDKNNAMYSKTFIFMYAVLCYGIFIIFDSIRNYNLFNLKDVIFDKDEEVNAESKIGTVATLASWMFYSLIVFQGIQFIGGGSNHFDTRHYISIAIMTLLWVGIIFVNTQIVNNQCETWKSKEIKNNYQEILVNILSFTILLIILSIGDRYGVV